MSINKAKRDKIVAQAITEIQFARTYKQGIVWRWFKNEDLFYTKKDFQYEPNTAIDSNNKNLLNPPSRSMVNIASAKMFSFVESYLSKIDSPLSFKFAKPTAADYKRAKLLNALKEQDANDGDWDFKDLMGKVNAILYGRAIFSYHADSSYGYCSYLECIDPYDFLIDPSSGGYDMDKARYLGRYNIKLDKAQLKKGKKEGIYIKEEVDALLKGTGDDANQQSQEDTNKQNKYSYIASAGNRAIQDTSLYKLWEWYTTYQEDGKRYYLLMDENGNCIRCEELTNLFKRDKKLNDAKWPFWSYSFIPNLTEFWVPAKTDYVREIFLAQGVNINQMIDNGEQINKPQRAVDVSSIENVADLVYRRNGIIRINPGVDINKSFKILETPEITTPIQVYNTLETIQQIESGVTAAAKGVAEEDKVGIYEGNQAATADRYGVANKSYSQGYKRFAMLWKDGVEEHLTTKTAVKILGPKGLEETVFISKRDVKPQADWNIIIESNNAEAQADAVDKRNKLEFLAGYKDDPTINQKQVFEKSASIVGFSSDDIRQFLDVSEYGTADMISEAERDLEDLLNKKIIEPNENADTAYVSHLLGYVRDHKEDMDEDTFVLIMDYIARTEEIVVRNMGTRMIDEQSKAGLMPEGADLAGTTSLSNVQPEALGQTENQLQINEPQGIS